MDRAQLQVDGTTGRPSARYLARRALNSQRFRPVILLCAALMVIFALQRGLLTVLKFHDMGYVSDSNMRRMFMVGFRLDLRVLGYLVLPLIPLLSLTPNRTFSRKWLQSILATYVASALVLAMTVYTVDTLFFMEKNARINWQVPNYLGEGQIVSHVWKNYPIVLIVLAVILVLVAVFSLVRRFCLAGPLPSGPPWIRLTCGVGMSAVLLACAYRPDVPSADSSDQAYFSANNMVTQLALNPVVTVSKAVKDHITEGEDEPEHYNLMSKSDAFVAARAALQQDHTVFDDGSDNPLWRTVHTQRPRRDMNVVVIIMESFAGRHVGALGHPGSQTPFFDELAGQGVFFSRMYASGSRTSRGLTAVLCGFPGLGGKSILKRPRAIGSFPSLFKTFADRGYRTSFIYGGDSTFDNMKDFFGASGLDTMVDEKTMAMPAGTWRTDWGFADHDVFAIADERFRNAGYRPFFSVVLTVTNHNPWKMPPGCIDPCTSEDEGVLMAHSARYADWAMEQFFRTASESDYFKNTVFVLVADHGAALDPRHHVDVEGYRVPCLFYAPGMADMAPRRIDVACSQTDVGSTLLSLLGGTFSHGTFGRDLLVVQPSDPGMALLRHDRRMALVRGDLALMEIPDSESKLFRHRPDGEMIEIDASSSRFPVTEMHRGAMGFYQSAWALYLRQAYGAGPKATR